MESNNTSVRDGTDDESLDDERVARESGEEDCPDEECSDGETNKDSSGNESEEEESESEDESEDEKNPSEVVDEFWLFEPQRDPTINGSGKWMLYYANFAIDSAWKKAKSLFRDGLLTGIACMKVSTAKDNPRSSSKDTQVIIFYCGPPEDETNLRTYGHNLVEVMGYKAPYTYKNSRYPNYIYYKSDNQTLAGTIATGNRGNHSYKIPVGVTAKQDAELSERENARKRKSDIGNEINCTKVSEERDSTFSEKKRMKK